MNQQPTHLIYGLEDIPSPTKSFFAALQHLLASFVGIITPTLIIGGVLGLGEHIPYLISMALMVSGVGTIIQAKRPLGIGAGLMCLQGTSFAFLSSVLAAGFMVKSQGGTPEDILAMIMGVCFFGAFVEIILSQFIHKLRRIVTPLVTGTVIVLIGVSLIKVGMTDLAGGTWLLNNKPELFAQFGNMFLGFLVLITVVVLNFSSNHWLRMSSVVIGLVVGFIVAALMGKVNFSTVGQIESFISIPIPFKYGIDFDFFAFLPIAFIYLITAIESTGDITANCMICNQDVRGPSYLNRIKQGVLGDGINSAVAAVFNTFPNTTFSQNNGVIQLTGIASRHVGIWVGAMLILLGLFPYLGSVLRTLPNSVLGGATLILFATVALAGIKILSTVDLNRRNMLTLAVSFGLGLGVLLVPEVVKNLSDNIGGIAGKIIGSVFNSAITTGGIAAIIMSLFFGEKQPPLEEEVEAQIAE